MSRRESIKLADGLIIPILYEDRAVLAIDKPSGWLLAPDSWTRTGRNLHLALMSSIRAGDFWARSRHLKFLRYIHRLDAETSGILLLAKSPGALRTFSELFEARQVQKIYFAVVRGIPKQMHWSCQLKLAPDPHLPGKMRADPRRGKDTETHFRVLQCGEHSALIEARPLTGRTHQIRVHLAQSGHPAVGDALYGRPESVGANVPARGLALRAVRLAYRDPFTRRAVTIEAPATEFIRAFLT
jgi:RluA family pseudouridine synthase